MDESLSPDRTQSLGRTGTGGPYGRRGVVKEDRYFLRLEDAILYPDLVRVESRPPGASPVRPSDSSWTWVTTSFSLSLSPSFSLVTPHRLSSSYILFPPRLFTRLEGTHPTRSSALALTPFLPFLKFWTRSLPTPVRVDRNSSCPSFHRRNDPLPGSET